MSPEKHNINTLSVILITKNEAHRIRRCLESVQFADEIIILDSGSTDNTVAICREFTEHVFTTDWPGFGPQKNRALEKASCDWVLSIDADEQLTPELTVAILQAMQRNDADGYTFLRQSIYCGKLIRHGDWRKDNILRLFKRTAGKFSNDIVHERIIVNGKIKHLPGVLLHDSFQTIEDVLNKMNHYSSLSAKQKHTHGKRASLPKAIQHGLWTFFKGYVLRRGFLDGKHGFMLAVSNAEGSYYRYLKISQLSEQ